jgi:hypothetical protein
VFVSKLRRTMTERCRRLQATHAAPEHPISHAVRSNELVDGRMIKVQNSTRLVVVLKNDEFVGKTVLQQNKIFEEETINIMLDYIRPGSTVVEAGVWQSCLGPARPDARMALVGAAGRGSWVGRRSVQGARRLRMLQPSSASRSWH